VRARVLVTASFFWPMRRKIWTSVASDPVYTGLGFSTDACCFAVIDDVAGCVDFKTLPSVLGEAEDCGRCCCC